MANLNHDLETTYSESSAEAAAAPPLQESFEDFQRAVADNPRYIYDNFMSFKYHGNQQKPSALLTPSSSSPTTPAPFDMQAFANVIAGAMQQVNLSVPLQSSSQPSMPKQSEKLPDIPEYAGEEEKLDAWEQALIHRMHANSDRYPTDAAKIAYAESRLTIGKPAHTLMGAYRVQGICYLVSFAEYRQKLRDMCGNHHEEHDARAFIRNTRQGDKAFDQYYTLFCQKMERAAMEDASLIDALQDNVNYNIQSASLTYRMADGRKPTTFAEYIDMYADIDREQRRLKNRLPRAANSSFNSSSSRSDGRKPHSSTPATKPTVAPVVVTPAVVPVSSGDPMDLSSAIALVKGKKTSDPGVREICRRFNLCFYCKGGPDEHPGRSAKDCPKKSTKATQLRSGFVTEIDDDQSTNVGVPRDMGKAWSL